MSNNDNLRPYYEALDDCRNVIDKLIDSLEDDFPERDGIDFLQVKNSLMISYLIDMTYLLRHYSTCPSASATDETKSIIHPCIERLNEMKVVWDKIRPLEKKMRYQIDKILALSTSSFAVVNNETFASEDNGRIPSITDADPLSFRPNLESMIMDDDSSDGVSADNNDTVMDNRKYAAKSTETERPMLYKPPRLTSVPFHEKERTEEREARIKKNAMEKMKKSELLQTIKAQFSDKPEEDDLRGGANVGKQREGARRFAERVAEKDRYEEDNMIRLSTSRKERKLRDKILRDEFSNLRAISDVGDLTSGVSSAFQSDKKNKRSFHKEDDHTEQQPKTRRLSNPRNQYQEALYGATTTSKKKETKKNRMKR